MLSVGRSAVGLPLLALMIVLVGALGFGVASFGHALQPGYLELRLIDKDLYAVVLEDAYEWRASHGNRRPTARAL